jgi:hypothetical protein
MELWVEVHLSSNVNVISDIHFPLVLLQPSHILQKEKLFYGTQSNAKTVFQDLLSAT